MPAGPDHTPPAESRAPRVPETPRFGWGIFALGVAALLACAGPGAWVAAGQAERLAEGRAALALDGLGADWAGAEADGLRLRLTGGFPDETAHNAALAALARSAPMAAVTDESRAGVHAGDGGAALAAAVDQDLPAKAPPAPPPPNPDAPLTLARDGEALVIAGAAHPSLVEAVREALAGLEAPPELRDATYARDETPTSERLALARAATLTLAGFGDARAEIGPGILSLSALAPDSDSAAAAEARLRAAAPPGTMLLLDIARPPPVLSPFRFVLALGRDGPALLGCDMRSAAERRAVLEALLALPGANFARRGDSLCRLGVGAPSLRWGEAAVAGVETLGTLGAGRFELIDSEARLVASPSTSPRRYDLAARDLAARMPPGFSLRLAPPPPGPRLPPPAARDGAVAEGTDGAEAAPQWFAVERTGTEVRLAGAAPDAPSRAAVAAFARARFGVGSVEDGLDVTDVAPPPAWRRAALAGLDALVPLAEGALSFDGATLRLKGRTERPAAARETSAALAGLADLGVPVSAAVTVDLPALAARMPLPPEECLARLQAEVDAEPIGFDPGAGGITAESRGVLDRLAALLQRCEGLVVEIAGHTDSQGRESTNLALSQARANAVMETLFARGVSLEKMTAEGYGEASPIADNGTEAGRARNRRIEFSDASAPLTLEVAE